MSDYSDDIALAAKEERLREWRASDRFPGLVKTAKEAAAQMYETQRAFESGNGKLEIGEVWNDGVDVPAPVAPPLTQTQREIVAVCDSIKELLLAKNRAYGDSALNPVRIFSKGSPLQQIEDRIDDKLSRIARGTATETVPEDTVRDLIGYLVLLLVARGRSGR